ncbi:hypothetical protein CBS101457_001206 [Exobasidium rhododendri]|nr:hypothetical protein CBS101457_001206 [Exobasidium rhododendri]
MPWVKSFRLAGLEPPMPECWGHRGASAAFPENTIASFERAIRDGSEGIESDVHITSDDVIIMFHDPSLERTTDGKGFIRDQAWSGGIENLQTMKEPRQQIPTFHQVCDLLMRPENMHVKLNIDIKADNNPDRLFRLMKKTVESYPDFATKLSPRLILGLWHPVFLNSALEHVPSLRRVHIGGSPTTARTYFWNHCDGFSMWFPSLVGTEGQSFIQQARDEGKDVFVWTVNRKDEMIEATRWGVKAILTDKTDLFQDVRKNMQGMSCFDLVRIDDEEVLTVIPVGLFRSSFVLTAAADYVTTRSEQVGLFFSWGRWQYYMLPQFLIQSLWISELERKSGVSFKGAIKKGGSLPKKEYAGKKTMAQKTIARQPIEEELDSVPPLIAEKEPSIPSAAFMQASPVAASA